MKFGSLLAATALTMALCVRTAPAEEGWAWSTTLYGWLSEMKGDIGLGPVQAPVDVSYSDTIDALDSLKGAAMLHVEAANQPYTLIGDLYYVHLGASGNTPLGEADLDMKQTIGEAAVAYTLPLNVRSVKLQALAGARYESIDAKLDVDVVGAGADDSASWTDPLVGARILYAVSPSVTLSARGDAAGFGVGSDMTWNAVAAAQWTVLENWVLGAGYRYLDVDYDHNAFVYNVRTQGPEVGLGYSW
jgi:hypothetical protein